MKWTEEQFWRSSPHAFHAACEIAYSRTPAGQAEERRRKWAEEMAPVIEAETKRNG
ncbi:MAG: hypothetical protein IRY96_07575 [Burkholderiales bacterium]|nr:hypothetical protein [Burkholderiales bacterium]